MCIRITVTPYYSGSLLCMVHKPKHNKVKIISFTSISEESGKLSKTLKELLFVETFYHDAPEKMAPISKSRPQ